MVLSKSPDSPIIRDIWAALPAGFRWRFTYHETVIVVQSTATVVPDNGSQVSVPPGDMAAVRARSGYHLDRSRRFSKGVPRRFAGPRCRSRAVNSPGICAKRFL
jgi:hypothetical protein